MMSYAPLISVVIPYYNPRFDYFQEAIESVLSQSYKNWEVIIVNDGSDSKSIKFLERFLRDLNDKRISLIHLDGNYGPAFARNKGIEASKGDFITFLDADDLHLPWFYEQVINSFSESNGYSILGVFDLFYLSLWRIKKISTYSFYFQLLEDNLLKESIVDEFKSAKLAGFPRLVFKREVFNHVKYNPHFIYTEDFDLLLQILDNEKLATSFFLPPISGYLYRLYSSHKRLSCKPNLTVLNIQKIIDKYLERDSLAGNFIRTWHGKYNHWKFNHLINNFLNGNSKIDSLKNALFNNDSFKTRVKGILTLINALYVYKVLLPLFGADSIYLKVLFKTKNNHYKKVKDLYLSHLENYSINNGNVYAKRIFEKVFK